MNKSELVLYSTPNGQVKIDLRFEDDTFWLSQRKIADLFGVDVRTINEHLKNIFKSTELDEEATIRNFRIVQIEGKREVQRNIEFYNLDAIIAVGYRVNSYNATQFRIWATQRLREYLTQGYAINKDRIQLNKSQFFKTIEDLKLLTKDIPFLEVKDVLDLIQNFSNTWFSLEQFDSQQFPKVGTRKEIEISAKELNEVELFLLFGCYKRQEWISFQ